MDGPVFGSTSPLPVVGQGPLPEQERPALRLMLLTPVSAVTLNGVDMLTHLGGYSGV